ncbi:MULTISPECIES: FAD-binding oxidoreductase [unclassified Streptomyces]|uniref:FAD-binding oxidoreductase n=1 Tax=unclassified Streptomyces TaxID=2593676 RepID=UPI00224E27E5|nr:MULTISPECIES: FAD-binding oxidoreductase [unclassified Streptomyces]MCX4529779.1 FAD-binding oxidoreductase [Streptomyces sp. NBC_01551]MCX4539649.1 FAD-binding oxidoreductase [Streptomyces sp. NBC_01565]
MSLHRRQVLARAAGTVLATIGAAAPGGAGGRSGGADPGGGGPGRGGPVRGCRRGTDFSALGRDIDGRVVLPGEREYAEARQLFQPRYDSVAPGAVVYPAHAGDVAVCLRFARRSTVPVVPRGGGHSYAGWSTRAAGLVVDTGVMAAVTVEGSGVRIGAGARLGDVNAALAGRGLAIPTGLCPSVGIAGLTLGGGLGLSARAYGATADRLTGALVVTPDGVVREADADRDPELFWALRGAGGGNFGVVSEFRFLTHRVGDCAVAELHWPGGDSAAVLAGWQRWLAGLPDPFWSQVEFVVEGGPESGPAVPAVRVVCLDGGRRELEARLTRLSDLVGRAPRDSRIDVRGYGDTMRALSGCLDRSAAQCRLPGTLPGRDPQGRLGRDSYAARSDFWTGDGLPPAAVEAVLDAVRRYPRAVPRGGIGVVQFDGVCGGALNRVPVAATAFAHRGSAFLAQYLVYWPESAPAAEVARHQDWLDGLWRDLRPWASGRAYQNYADPKLDGWREAYHGPNLPRLEQVRRVYDPDRLFRFPQAI